MTEPHLILHKVRGKPAFDVAIRIICPVCSQGLDLHYSPCADCDDLRFWWIIPTSGHRAYPYWFLRLDELLLAGELAINTNLIDMPPDWPDHYACNDKPVKPETFVGSLLDRLGLVKKIDRRM